MTPFKANYDAIAKHWIGLRRAMPERDEEFLQPFLDSLPANAQVLDLGCGHGVPLAQTIIEAGHGVTGVDRSASLLARARDQFPEQLWCEADLEDYQPKTQFDGIVIWDAMFHLPRSEQAAILKRVRSALKPGAQVILTSGGSDTEIPPFSDQMFEQPFFYDAYPVPELLALCEQLGYRIEDQTLLNVPDGERDKGRLGLRLSYAQNQ